MLFLATWATFIYNKLNSPVTPLDVINKVASTCWESGQLLGPLICVLKKSVEYQIQVTPEQNVPHPYSVKANQKCDRSVTQSCFS